MAKPGMVVPLGGKSLCVSRSLAQQTAPRLPSTYRRPIAASASGSPASPSSAQVGLRRLRPARLQHAPWPTPQVDRDQARRPRGHDVVVDPVADVRDRRRRQRELGGDAGVERRVGLLDAPALATSRRGRAGRRARAGTPRSPRAGCRRRRRQAAARAARAGTAGRRGTGRAPRSPSPRAAPRPPRGRRRARRARTRRRWSSPPRRQAAEHPQQRQPRHAERVRPGLPRARLVDERLADVEDDRRDPHSSAGPSTRTMPRPRSRTSPSSVTSGQPSSSASARYSAA